MSPSPIPGRSKDRHIVLFFLALGLLVPLSLVAWRLNLSHRLNKRLATLGKAGYPTTMEDLERMYYPPVKPEDNAAIFFTNAFAHLKLSNSVTERTLQNSGTIKMPKGTELFTPEFRSNVLSSLAENREALDLLRTSPIGKAARYPIDFKQSAIPDLPHLKPLKASAALLSLEACLNSDQGRLADAIQNLDVALRVTDSLADEPVTITQLVRIVCQSYVISALQHVLNHGQLSDAQLIHLDEAIHREDNPRAMERAMAGDLCSGAAIFRTFPFFPGSTSSADSDADDPSPEQRAKGVSAAHWLLKLTGITAKDFNYFLNVMSEYLSISKLAYPRRLDETESEEKRVDFELSHGRLHLVSRMLMPAYARVSARDCAAAARLNIVQTALAIERFRLANQDRIPDKLGDLVPAFLPSVTLDPFDGQPLRFKKLHPGYLVYSIGPDRKDDGGIEYSETKPKVALDIVFTVVR